MKTVPKLRSGVKSCSCSTCVYKSESDRPSLRRFIDDGSRIDRLYYGKYIPLREKKLLERLVRTRAVYDDIRARLLSDSTISLSTMRDFGKKTSSGEVDDSEKSSAAILKFVNMVDKGDTLESVQLSDCCNCCSCSSRFYKSRVQEHYFKIPRQKKALVSTYDNLNARERAAETYNRKKGVGFKAKNIRSDPCTCTFKFSGLLKKRSKTLLKRTHPPIPLPVLDLELTFDQEMGKKRGLGDMTRASYQNLQQTQVRLKEKISEGMNKIKESQTSIREKLQVQTKKSLEKLTQATNKLASTVKASAQKLRIKTKTETMCLCPNKEIAFQVKKDSISKFKEDLMRKQIMKDWECEPECVEKTCIPEACFIRLKKKRSKRNRVHHKGIKHQNIMKERNIGESLNRSVTKSQTGNLTVAKNVTTENKHPILLAGHVNAIKEPDVDFDNTTNRKKVKKPILAHTNEENNICACETFADTYKKIKVEPSISLTRKLEKNSMQDIKVRYRPKDHKLKKVNVEKKNKDTNRTIKAKEFPLAATSENRNPKKIKESSIPNKHKIQKTTHEQKSSQRQAVRVGSTFSFNIEFSKNKTDPKLSLIQLQKTPTDYKQRSGIGYRYKKSIKDKTKKRQLRHKGSQIILKSSFKDNKTGGYALRRCFCTLMLKAKATNKVKTREKSDLTLNSSELSHKKLSDIQTNTLHTKIIRRKKKKVLLPYECESAVCMPGNCNPYQCIELINMRDGKHKNISASCVCPAYLSSSRKTKSTSSFTSRSRKPSKAKFVQSVTYQDHIYSRPAVEKKTLRQIIEKKSDRQAVRVGSTFSFNIEFYKGRPTYNARQTELKSLSIKPKQKTYQKVNVKHIRRNSPIEMYKKERNVGTTLKRCFCTLKLQKNDFLKTQSRKTVTKGTKPMDPNYLHIDTENKSTKTKSKYGRNLEPFECAPFTCTPGSCDPYICWDIIKKRNIRLKEAGFTTKRPETVTSSTTYSGKPLKTVQIQYKPKCKQHKVLANTQKICKIPKKYAGKKPSFEYSSSAMSNQVVKIGSTFSFDIEFHKEKVPNKSMTHSYPPEKKTKTSTAKILKNKSIERNQLNVAHIYTQVDETKKKQKSSYVRPILNRCFCTLNLRKKLKNYSKTKTDPIVKPTFPPERIYTVNRAIFQNTHTKFTNGKYQTNVNHMPIFNGLQKHIGRNLLKTKINSNINSIYNLNACRRNLLQLNYKSEEVPGWQPVKTSSNICEMQNIFDETRQSQKTLKMYPLKNIKEIKKCIKEAVDFRNFNRVRTSTCHAQYKHLLEHDNNINPAFYFGRSFYAMNLKVNNGGILQRREIKNNMQPTKLNKRALKIKSYECEPGICIPGECDPYECQKLISKRLEKKNVKKSGTNYKSQSVGSFASECLPQSKSNKQQTLSLRSRKSSSYKDIPNHGDTQAVRIGSSFSFDIRFSKYISTSRKDLVVPKYSSNTKLSNWTTRQQKKIDSQSQCGFFKTKHKGSLTKPAIRRCFCTLKLQKRGRLQKKIQNEQPMTSNEFRKVKTTTRGQNTKKFKPLNLAKSIKPYECEPNICVPGQCDPYKCLEIMKKRNYNKCHNEFGTSILPNYKSVSSITDDQINKLRRNRAISVNPKSAVNDMTVFNKYFDNSVTKTSRNTLTLGSSFSFNAEFFKDRSPIYNYTQKESNGKQERNNQKKRSLERTIHLPKERYQSNAVREHSSNYKTMRHNRSQSENFARSAATLTDSAFKRCFCTSPLYESKNVQNTLQSRKNKHSSSFLNKCLCFFKRKNRPKNLHMDNKLKRLDSLDKIIKTQNATGLSNLIKRCFCTLEIKDSNNNLKGYKKNKEENSTKVKTKSVMAIEKRKYGNELKPFECESNVCTPYRCNPYYCEKLIKLRHKKKAYREFGNTTPYSRIMSTASITDFYKKPETKSPDVIKNNVHPRKKKGILKNSDTVNIVQSKQSVRIGSTFSFNIEFSKDKTRKDLKKYGKKYTSGTHLLKRENYKKNMINKTYTSNDKMETHSTMTVFLPIKRCFCTLSLRKRNKQHLPAKKLQASVSTRTKEPMLNLLPYECEPNNCIPGECNPIECLYKIKKRYFKNTGTAPGYTNKKHASVSMPTRERNIKNKKSQLDYPIKPSSHISFVNPKKKLEKGSFKQAVRIGSTFSFDIEFFKNKTPDNNEKFKKAAPLQNHKMIKEKIRKKTKEIDIRQNNEVHKYLNKDLLNKWSIQKVNDVVTKKKRSFINPLYKRCFCIFKLHKMGKQGKHSVLLKNKINKSQTVQYNKENRGPKLEPFECEPNACTPGRCNPYECEKRIRKRLFKEFGTDIEKYPNVSTFSETNKPISKPVKIQTLKMKSPKQKNIYIKKTDEESNANGQVIRIGSNFNFDVEFFKNRGLRDHKVFSKREVKSKMTTSSNKVRSQSLQVNKKDSKTVPLEPLSKRCFCTLKLQKIVNNSMSVLKDNIKQISEQTKQHKLTENKCFTTNKTYRDVYELSPYECEPFYCTPGECDPFLCEKRIKLKEKEKKMRNTGNQVLRKCSQKCVGLKGASCKCQRTQTYDFDAASPIAPQMYQDRLGIVEIPKFTNIFNREAVKVGSNFSFKLEFYKETLPQRNIVELTNDKKFKIKNKSNAWNDHPKVDAIILKNRGTQGHKIWTDEKCKNAGNALKRCFCTSKLQNQTKLKTQNLMPLVKRPQFPQNLEVRRVAVKHKRKMLPKYTNIEVKSVGTRINKKYTEQKKDCKFCQCQNSTTLFSDDMKTILPYRPRKFNKTFSLTELHLQNFTPIIGKKYKKPQENVTTDGKTREKTENFLRFNKEPLIRENTIPKVMCLGFRHFFTRCAQILFRQTSKTSKTFTLCEKDCNKQLPIYNHIKKPDRQNKIVRDGLKPSKSERAARLNQLMTQSQPKKTTSLKFRYKYDDYKKCKKTCPYYANQMNKTMLYQCGDFKCESPVMSLKINRKPICKNSMNDNLKGENRHAQRILNIETKPKSLKQQNNSYKNEDFCTHCLMPQDIKKSLISRKGHSTPLKVQFMDVAASNNKLQHKRCHNKKNGDYLKKPMKHDTKSDRVVFLCKYCHSCGRQLNKDEFDRAAGDKLLKQTKSSRMKSANDKGKKKKIVKNDNVCSGKQAKTPLFELQLDSSSYDILNKDEVNYNVTKFNKRSKKLLNLNHDNEIHGKSCQCCICLAKKCKNESELNITAKASKVCKALSSIIHDPKTKIKTASGKPCVCGSLVCDKKAQKIASKVNLTKQRYKWKPCVCGSTVCDRESAIMKTISGKSKCICQKEKAKRNKKLTAKKLKIENKEHAVRLKRQSKDDRKRLKKRRKDNKRLERQINKNSSDVVLLTDTVIDIGKLGVTACSDILRVVARSAQDPKHACKTLKTMKDNPNLLIKHLKSAYADSGLVATKRRVRLRCLAMRGVKKVKAKLESYAITKYLLNVTSKNPKSRLVKPHRVRERFDFGCSLYMGSLRKRPFLSIYDRCPVFYPHCLALVNVWKQFMDISLFLLAVVVWSPCILCMELCRACMCCFFCTG